MRLVFFHPTLNRPTFSGGDVHTHEILLCLKKLGFKIYLFVLETEEKPVVLRDNWGYEDLHILKEQDRSKVRSCLSDYIKKVDAEAVWVNYPSWDPVLNHEEHKNCLRILYNHHFESVRKKMARLYHDAWNLNLPTSINAIHPSLYELDFYKNADLSPDPKEYAICDQYDLVFAIEDFGSLLLKEHCNKAKVVSFPVTLSDRECYPEYAPMALYTMSPYSFNFQGYYFFIKEILPLIREKSPLFRTRLVGLGSEFFLPTQNVICKKYVKNLEDEYKKSRLTLCPAFSGTGQQVKIIESMHYGVPVVCMENKRQYNPIEHQKTGFICKTPQEFAYYATKLYQDADFAKKIGLAAQKSARENYNHSLLLEALSTIFDARVKKLGQIEKI